MPKAVFWTPPNLLTCARILAAPWLGITISRRDYATAFPILIAAGITDALDGYLARRFNWHSRAGAYLDPIADKLLAATVFLGLGFSGALEWWIIWLIFGRDLLILAFAGCALAFTRLRDFPPSAWGKLSTLLQVSLGAVVLLTDAWPGHVLARLGPPIKWLAVAATAWSGLDYVWRGVRMLRSSIRAEQVD